MLTVLDHSGIVGRTPDHAAEPLYRKLGSSDDAILKRPVELKDMPMQG